MGSCSAMREMLGEWSTRSCHPELPSKGIFMVLPVLIVSQQAEVGFGKN